MKKRMIILMVGILFALTSCSTSGKLSGSKPPETFIKIGTETYATTLGTYCWSSTFQSVCVDTAGPVELLEGKKPIEVAPGEEITFVMDYEPQPNEIHVSYFKEDVETEVEVKNHRFTAPEEKGVYYYAYSVWWLDEKEEHVSKGDAFYAFALEVK
jgi:hypothetical protein